MIPPFMDGEHYRMKLKQYEWTKLDFFLNAHGFVIGKWSILQWKWMLQCKISNHTPMIMYPTTPKDDFAYRIFCSRCGELLTKVTYGRGIST